MAVFNRKPAIFPKQGKIGPRLPLITMRKLHTNFQFVPKSILDDLEGRYTLLCTICGLRIDLNEDRPTLSVVST